MCLDTSLMERLCPFTYCNVRILSKEEVNLFEAAAVCLHTIEASHSDNCRSHLDKLVNSWLILAGTLPHVPENKAEFDFFHN